MRKQGFSLLDLLIVIMILGVVGVIVAPELASVISDMKLNESTSEIVCAIQYTQSLAAHYQRPFYFRAIASDNAFQVGDYRYRSDGNAHMDADPPAGIQGVIFHPITKAEYQMDFDTVSEYMGVRITGAPAGNDIYFYPDGHSSNDNATICLQFGEKQRTITIDGNTGSITVN